MKKNGVLPSPNWGSDKWGQGRTPKYFFEKVMKYLEEEVLMKKVLWVLEQIFRGGPRPRGARPPQPGKIPLLWTVYF